MNRELYTKLRALEFQNRQLRLSFAEKQKTVQNNRSKTDLHVVYVIHHNQICGGLKIILEHTNRLFSRGVKVTIVSHQPKPTWFLVKAHYVEVPFHLELAKGIPPCDVIVAGYWDQIQACIEMGIAPVVYFEQGDFHLFEYEKIDSMLKSMLQKQFTLPRHIVTVSTPAAKKIAEHFYREAYIIPNGLDETIFYFQPKKHQKWKMLIVGDENVAFKGIKQLIHIHELLVKRGVDIELIWITPSNPTIKSLKNVRIYVAPDQYIIGELYREATIYVCNSSYEAFGLPGLEAMACGTPVITSKAEGVFEYAIDLHNCFMVDAGDTYAFIEKIECLLKDQNLYNQFQKNAIKTAENYKWKNNITELINFYQKVSREVPIKRNELEDWELTVSKSDLENVNSWNNVLNFLQTTKADEVLFPVKKEFHSGYEMLIWSPLAKRKHNQSQKNIEKLPIKVKHDDAANWTFQEIIHLYESNELLQGLQKLKQLLKATTSGSIKNGIGLRWTLLFLLKMNRLEQAKMIAEVANQLHPLYTDIRYLLAICYMKFGDYEKARQEAEICKWIGEAAIYHEFIGNITNLAEKLLEQLDRLEAVHSKE